MCQLELKRKGGARYYDRLSDAISRSEIYIDQVEVERARIGLEIMVTLF